MKTLKLSKPAHYLLSLLTTLLLLTTAPLVSMAATFNINILADSVSPSEITITVGDTVVWTVLTPPAVVVGDPSGAGIGADGICQETLNGFLLSAGDTYSHTFMTVGDCHYGSTFIQARKGIIHVLAPPTTTTTTTTTSTTTTTNCNNQGKDKDKGKGHNKGRCTGHDKR